MNLMRILLIVLVIYATLATVMLRSSNATVDKLVEGDRVRMANRVNMVKAEKAAELAAQQAIETRKYAQNNIIINAAPKSGSAYIAKSLENGLHYEHMTISNEYIPRDQISYIKMKQFYGTGMNLSKQHFEPSVLNIQILKRFTDRIVVNFRDPREILLSWVHHLNSQKALGEDLHYFEPEPPQEYFSLSLEQQIDWNIDHFLPGLVKWMQSWIIFKQHEKLSDTGMKLLFTTYDEFLQNELQLYHKILAFYGIPLSNFTFDPPQKDLKVHYRKGDPNEWRAVYTAQQKAKIAKIVPSSLLSYFSWDQ